MHYIAAASGIMNMAGALADGKAQEQQYLAYAKANRYNAAVGRQRAEWVRSGTNLREEQERRKGRLEEGTRRAWAAQSGTGFGGSNADVERQQRVFSEMDALNIRYEGHLAAKSMEDDARMEDWQAELHKGQGKYARRSSYLAAASSLLSGGASAYRAYKQK